MEKQRELHTLIFFSFLLGKACVANVTYVFSGFFSFLAPLQLLKAIHFCLQDWFSAGGKIILLGQWSGDFPSAPSITGVEMTKHSNSASISAGTQCIICPNTGSPLARAETIQEP